MTSSSNIGCQSPAMSGSVTNLLEGWDTYTQRCGVYWLGEKSKSCAMVRGIKLQAASVGEEHKSPKRLEGREGRKEGWKKEIPCLLGGAS